MSKKPTIKSDGYIIRAGYRIRKLDRPTGVRYQLDLGTRGGKHVRISFKTLVEAEARAVTARTEFTAEGIDALKFTDDQKRDASEALKLLERSRTSLTDAARFFIKHTKAVTYETTVAGLVAQYLEEQMAREDLRPASKTSTKRFLTNLSDGLGHMAIETVADADIIQWLDDEKFKPTSRHNNHRYASLFLNWCVKQKVIDANPIIEISKKPSSATQIYTPAQVQRIMDEAVKFAGVPVERKEKGKPIFTTYRTEAIVYLALGLFAGLRPDEILRLNWSAFDWDTDGAGVIAITPEVSKTNTGRHVTVTGNLLTYLAPYRKDSGLVFPFSYESVKSWIPEIMKNAKVESIQDGARHSYATYNYALHGLEDTIDNLGHTDSKMFMKHYKGLAKNRKTAAEKFFQIAPKKGTIIEFRKEGVA